MSTKAKAKPVIEFKVLAIDPFGGEDAPGDQTHIEWNGKQYYVERWATHHASGEEWYDADKQPIKCPMDDDTYDRFDTELLTFQEDHNTLWRRYVEPAMSRAMREAQKRQERRHA